MPARFSSRLVVLLLVFLVALAGLLWKLQHSTRPAPKPGTSPAGPADLPPEFLQRLAALEARERAANEDVWAPEILAQEHGAVIDGFWDALNASSNMLATAAAAAPPRVLLPRYGAPEHLPHGMDLWAPSAEPGQSLDAAGWAGWLARLLEAGWQARATEFRHVRFEPPAGAHGATSVVYFAAELESPAAGRALVEGDLRIEWAPRATPGAVPAIQAVNATGLSLRTRLGAPPFDLVLDEAASPPAKSFFIDPLILHDLDGDGLSEIILVSANVILKRRPDWSFERQPLCATPAPFLASALVADFDGDGRVDLLCASFERLTLFTGTGRAGFDGPGRLVWKAEPRLRFAQVMTAGDVDNDGDLDLWLGQYKVPYQKGQIPTPFHDANDGYPAHLLANDGTGAFRDSTLGSGLEPKRNRRTYSASFGDFNGDHLQDLLVVSDFHGMDLYAGDGQGHFRDVTRDRVATPYAAGMAHAFADFDGDGADDLMMIGMTSATVDRLDAMGLWRDGYPGELRMRTPLMAGNRLLFGAPGGRFAESPMSDSVRRSGWSWGVSAFDFDNDSFPDLLVANGHETKSSTRDYDPEFWLHDIFAATSQEDAVAHAYLIGQSGRTRAQGWSYGGWERNRFYWNVTGRRFVEAGWLLGLSSQSDSRNVVSDDLDGDGRTDLVVTTFEVFPATRQTVKVYRNRVGSPGAWIGVRPLADGRSGGSPIGAMISVHPAGSPRVLSRQLMTGDSYRSQHAPVAHFGLGKASAVDRVEVRWPDGGTTSLTNPSVNQVHPVARPAAR